MKYAELPLKGAFLIDLDLKEDSRGFFARVFCSNEFTERGLESHFCQVNNSLSVHAGTLRGMHYQIAPFEEVKLVRCLTGSLFDVILDLRQDSPTFGESFGTILTASNRKMMYVPKGFAHGFLTLEPNTEIFYFVSQNYSKEAERGVRWDDPAFKIKWPHLPKFISERDQQHEDFIHRR